MELRDVAVPTYGREGTQWLTLEAARAVGVDLSYVADGIGPRVRGMVYRGGYLDTVNTVHDVFIEVMPPVPGSGRAPRAVYWEVAEQSGDDVRVRRHCTSWTYERRNRVLFMLDTSGS